MKAIILAAGMGKRMRPITEQYQKVMIPIREKPFLHYLIQNLKQAGVTDIAFVTGYKQEQIQAYLQQEKIDATLIPQEQAKGSGHAIHITKEFCKDDDFIVLCGDNFYSVEDIKAVMNDDNYTYLIGKQVEDPSKYGVLQVDDDGYLKEIVEKPQEFVGDLINTGIYKFTKELWAPLSEVTPSARGEIEIVDAITALAKEKKVKVLALQKEWKDLGRPEDIPIMERYIDEYYSA